MTAKIIRNKFNKIRFLKPDFSFIHYALLDERIILKNYHFYVSSCLLHLLIILPIFFKLFIYYQVLDNKPLEEIIYLSFDKPKIEQNTHTTKRQNIPEYKSKTKNNESQITEKSQLSKITQKKILKDYQEQLSNHVGIILEENIDNYNIDGNFTAQFSIKKNGIIDNIILSKRAEDELSNKNLLKILKKIRKFQPLPNSLSMDMGYFEIDLEIEQD